MARVRTTSESRTEKPKSVGIWIRVSTEDQAKGESPEHHEKRARCYAEAKGWHVARAYHLEAVSGKAVMAHPESQRMLADIRSGLITGLIFSKLARLARSTRELLDFADIFRDHQADLISLHESIDTTTPAGRLFYTLIAAMAQWEREEIAERVAASVPIRAKLGKSTGGAAPYGYQWKDRRLTPDPKEAPVRKLMYELFLEHGRKRTVARLLNDAGYRTRSGARFSDTTVMRLLCDPVAKGVRRANYTKSLGNGRAWKWKPEADWVLSPVEPIVTADVWDRCNAMIEETGRSRRRPGPRPVHLFTGVVYCHCGQRMYVPSNMPKYTCYRCRNKIPVGDLEAVFQERLASSVTAPNEIGELLAEADETLREKGALVETLTGEAQGVRRGMDKVYKLYLNDQITGEGFKREYGPLEQRLAELSNEIPRLQAEADLLRMQYLSRDELLHEAQNLYGNWSALTFEEKRQLVENIVERITIGPDEIEIALSYLPPPVSPGEDMAEKQHNLTDSLPKQARSEPGTSP